MERRDRGRYTVFLCIALQLENPRIKKCSANSSSVLKKRYYWYGMATLDGANHSHFGDCYADIKYARSVPMTQPKDIQNEAKKRVLAVYPRALAHWIPLDDYDPFSICQIYRDDASNLSAIGDGNTEEEAWQDAASKLTP